MRVSTLRVKDIAFNYQQIIVREGKGDKDRHTVSPAILVEPLQRHLRRVKPSTCRICARDLVGFTYRLPWPGNIQTLILNRPGNTFSQRPVGAQIPSRESFFRSRASNTK